MKRALAITLTVAMIGALAFMGFAGTAAAQENNETGDIDFNIDSPIQDTETVAETGDASNEVNLEQSNNNAQIGSATAGDAVALSDGGAPAAAGQATHDKGGTAQAGAAGNGGSATAASMAETNQAQDVQQANVADIDQTADTSVDQNVSPEQDVEGDDVTVEDADLTDLEDRVSDLEETQEAQGEDIADLQEFEGEATEFVGDLYDADYIDEDDVANPWE